MNNFKNTDIYKKIVTKKNNLFFISPHLDDSIFSAGGLMYDFYKKDIPMTIINVFTNVSNPPYSVSVKRFIRKCGYSNARDLFKDRINEDSVAAKKIRAKVINLGFVDALWRKKNVKGIFKILSKYIPEVDYVYPFFRFNITTGIISSYDSMITKKILNKVSRIISRNENPIIFAPLAIGNHIDHLIVRNVCRQVKGQIIYWSDYPYLKNHLENKVFINDNLLHQYKYKILHSTKEKLINIYKSQIKAIFGRNKELVSMDEIYFL